jgi:hypothetical protein
MATGTQMQTVWALWIRDLAETLETHLAEVKHKGELKLLHPEPLPHGRFLHAMIHWKSRQATTSRLPCRPTRLLPTRPSAHRLQTTTGGLQHHQMPAPNLPRRNRQTGLDAKVVTPELLRLKLYCFWTRDFFCSFFSFFFLFSLSICLSCSLSDCLPYLLVDFFGSPFFFFPFFFFFLLLSWFC